MVIDNYLSKKNFFSPLYYLAHLNILLFTTLVLESMEFFVWKFSFGWFSKTSLYWSIKACRFDNGTIKSYVAFLFFKGWVQWLKVKWMDSSTTWYWHIIRVVQKLVLRHIPSRVLVSSNLVRYKVTQGVVVSLANRVASDQIAEVHRLVLRYSGDI